MHKILLFIVLLPCGLLAQSRKGHPLDLADVSLDLSGLSFRVNEVRDETGVVDGRYGTVYTGMLNKTRDLVIPTGLELNWKTAFLRNTADRNLPTATLLVRFFRLDEEITATSERRRIQLEAALALTEDGAVYGPQVVTSVQGGLDVTSGHPDAVAAALVELLGRLEADVQAGNLADAGPRGKVAYGSLPDGVYYSAADYRIGKPDTDFTLTMTGRQRGFAVDGMDLYEADFRLPEDVSRRRLREIWGCQYGGVAYLYLQGRFYAIRTDADGTSVVGVPGGITDPEALTKQMAVGGLMLGAVGGAIAGSIKMQSEEEVFQIDLTSGALEPYAAGHEQVPHPNRILLHYVAGPDSPDITASVGDRQYRLAPGQYIDLDEEGALTLASADGSGKPRSYRIWDTVGQPTLFVADVNAKGKVTLTRAGEAQARQAAAAADSGIIHPAPSR